MGLIKAAVGAVGGTLADQWKEYIYCDAIDKDVLVVAGQNKNSKRSSNKRGETNVISDGSAIAVADGQCMMIVEQGRVLELSAEPGIFVYDSKTTPSIFAGDMITGLKGAARDAFERFKFGGGAGKDQRVYYFNTKEILGNKYGTAAPIPFKVIIDRELGKSIEISVRCNGEYSYKIVNPMAFYTNICGNVESEFKRGEIDSQLKSELLQSLNVAFGKLALAGVSYSEIPLHTEEIAEALNEALSKKWGETRGIQVASFATNSVSVSDADIQRIQNMQTAFIMQDPSLAQGNIASARADAMRAAAANENGGMMGFMGMGMADAAGAAGMQQQQMAAMQQQMAAMQQQMNMQQSAAQAPGMAAQAPSMAAQQKAAGGAGSWTCSCGAVNQGKFCMECGAKMPEPEKGWTCQCGAVNQGKFCPECGAKKPEGAPLYKCDKCGWEPDDPMNPPKFCPECGDIFDENDKQ